MADFNHLAILRSGVEAWNKHVAEKNDERGKFHWMDLTSAELSGTCLRGADLLRVDLRGADLNGADLTLADLLEADLTAADMRGARLRSTRLSGAHLADADLRGADLGRAKLDDANLRRADLRDVQLQKADLSRSNVTKARFSGAKLWSTSLGGVMSLADADGLTSVQHLGPSHVGIDTLVAAGGRLPASFLAGCGLRRWELEFSKLFDPELTAVEIAQLLSVDVFQARTEVRCSLGVRLFPTPTPTPTSC